MPTVHLFLILLEIVCKEKMKNRYFLSQPVGQWKLCLRDKGSSASFIIHPILLEAQTTSHSLADLSTELVIQPKQQPWGGNSCIPGLLVDDIKRALFFFFLQGKGPKGRSIISVPWTCQIVPAKSPVNHGNLVCHVFV